MKSNVVSFINMKGGVGKTTLAVNVGYTLSKEFGKKVLLIDVDPQMNATQYTLNNSQVKYIMENPKSSLYGILYEIDLPAVTSSQSKENKNNTIISINNNFDIIPSHLGLMSLDLDKHPYKLKQYMKDNNLKSKYDTVIMDLPPTISIYTMISLLASDHYLVPIKTDYLSFFGLPLLQDYICHLKSEFELSLDFLGIVLTMARPGLKIYKDIKKMITENDEWKEKLFNSELKYKTDIERALSPEEKKRNSPYIIELGDKELENQMINITQEFMRKMRL